MSTSAATAVDLVAATRDIFLAGGALAQSMGGFQPRTQQVEMAVAVAQALHTGHHLVAEAGTGVGKTYAYLIPVMLSGRKAVISTAGKTLQDQLFDKDLPALRQLLGWRGELALLKGRGNYACLYRMELAQTDLIAPGASVAVQLVAARRWSNLTVTGDVAELAEVPEHSPIWPWITSTADNCLGQDCPRYRDCFVVKARRRALDADITVVNHHVLCADWALRESGFGELLPAVAVTVVDEAHRLPEIAAEFLGSGVSSRQFQELAADVAAAVAHDARDMRNTVNAAAALTALVERVRANLTGDMRKGPWDELMAAPGVGAALTELAAGVSGLNDCLAPARARSPALEQCAKRGEVLSSRLRDLLGDVDDDWVRWYEVRARGFVLHRTPVHVAEPFQAFLEQLACTWIFTSATLSVAGDFALFCDELGLAAETQRRSWDSPYDYRRQALCYVPPNLPEPNSWGYTEALVHAVVPILRASAGRAFFLFTSHVALQQAAQLLAQRIEFPLLVQGTKPKAVLVQEFLAAGNAVLLGAASFWEGVDVRGSALSVVIIDRLPFAAPDDPVLQARIDTLKQQGRNPFIEYQLPAAVMALRQGVGRLIRDADDRGVVVLGDPRLFSRAYGKIFRHSLPPMPLTRSEAEACQFFVSSTS